MKKLFFDAIFSFAFGLAIILVISLLTSCVSVGNKVGPIEPTHKQFLTSEK